MNVTDRRSHGSEGYAKARPKRNQALGGTVWRSASLRALPLRQGEAQALQNIELIIDEQAWLEGYRMPPHVVPRHEPIGPVLVKINYHEVKLRNAVKEAGGQWYPKERHGSYLCINEE